MTIKNFKKAFFASVCLSSVFVLAHMGWKLMQRANESVFKVRGIAERTVKADRVVWTVTSELLGNQLEDTLKRAQIVKTQFIAFCEKEGLGQDFKPEFTQLSTTDFWAYNRTRYEDNTPPTSVPVAPSSINTDQEAEKKARYKVTLTLLVESRDVDKVCHASTKLPLSIPSVTLNGDLSYYYTNFDKLRENMAQEAFQSALKIAQALGKKSNMRVGRVKDLSQGLFTISTPNNPSVENPWNEKESIIKIIRTVSTVIFAAHPS